MQYDNIYLPIVHPVIDFGSGLNRLKRLESKIPFVNIFCSFYSNINVFESKSLGKKITLTDKFLFFYIYSHSIEISELFRCKKERLLYNVYISKKIFNIAFIYTFISYFTLWKSH
jgi:hypothetical protein